MDNQQQQQILYSNLGIDIKLDKANATYRAKEWITGYIQVYTTDNKKIGKVPIKSLKISAEGLLNAQNKTSNKTLDSICQSLKPIQLLSYSDSNLQGQEDYITNEINQFPFKFKLEPVKGQKLIETYVGVYISIAYEIQAELRIDSTQILKQQVAIFVQVNNQGRDMMKPDTKIPHFAPIEMSPEKLLSSNQSKQCPKFLIKGGFNSDVCFFGDDLNGHFIIHNCEGKIRTIDLQLIRVEKVETSVGKFQEATEIQLIQVADGNVARNIEIPMYMIFPVYFCCPNFNHKEFQVDFEVNFIMILFDGFKITMNFPINILRN